RSITHDLSVHDDATHWLQTGYPLLNARQKGQQNPSQGSVVSYFRSDAANAMPPYVCIPEDYRRHLGFYEHAAFLSSRHNALDAGGDPSLGNYRPPNFALPKEINVGRIQDRRQLFGALDQLHRKTTSLPQFADLDDVQQQSFELVCGSQAREAFDLSQEPEQLRDRYGRHAYGQSALLARRLVESGVSFVTINLYEKDVDWWDDHYKIESNLRKRLPAYDQALSTLIEDLEARGQRDRVLVAAFGEFGRAPRIDANAGRGHWAKAMHAVLSGGGLKDGQIVGSTTSNGGEPHDRPLKPADLLATMYHAIGIDQSATVIDRQNRPIPILPEGEPIRELV
ncbi:MAG: arylsulfatase A-like enzyme, partial [Planctomycetaceae bacterium]